MVHRDPETGQFLSHDDEPIDLTYADHEFVNLKFRHESDQGEGTNTVSVYQVDSDVLDLENDELGMLTWMTASVVAATTGFQAGDTTRGGALVTAEVGSNLAGDEFLGKDFDTDGGTKLSEQPASIEVLEANDEAGLWAVLNTAVSAPFKDDGQATAGGGDQNGDRLRRPFMEETNGGPYIDSTDDITVGVRVDKEDANLSVYADIVAQMSFAVFEYDNRRAEFAPYDVPFDV